MDSFLCSTSRLLSPVLYEGLLEVDKRVRGYVLVAKQKLPGRHAVLSSRNNDTGEINCFILSIHILKYIHDIQVTIPHQPQSKH